MHQVIIHLDLDFFYGQCEQARNPSLTSLPFAIQQKHIVVTCNYLARARGVRKLQLLTDAKRVCPNLIIVNGEDIQRYRDASKAVYRHVRGIVGANVQRLGMDELWIDVTDHVSRHLQNSSPHGRRVFELGPRLSFNYFVGEISGHFVGTMDTADVAHQELIVASQLAAQLRESVRAEFSFTSSAGISTSKIIAKLVGDIHKPNDQTLIFPEAHQDYLDTIQIKKIAGVGYVFLKTLFDKLGNAPEPHPRSVEIPFVCGATTENCSEDKFETSELSGDDGDNQSHVQEQDDGDEFKLISKEKEELLKNNKQPLTVLEVRQRCNLPDLQAWFGTEKGSWLWDVLHARDVSVVEPSSLYPKSIGLEDSFLHCTTLDDVMARLLELTTDLIVRMEGDLRENGRWIRWPSILRLTPRFRGDQERGELWRHKRTSRSVALPVEIFEDAQPIEARARRLVGTVLMPLFKKIISDKPDWDLSLLNVAVADMKFNAPSGGILGFVDQMSKSPVKRKLTGTPSIDCCPDGMDDMVWRALDEMTRQQLLQELPAQDTLNSDSGALLPECKRAKTETSTSDLPSIFSVGDGPSSSVDDAWPEVEEEAEGYLCEACASVIPVFAISDHVCLAN